MANSDIDLMAHLMRRAGFGATRDELEALVEKDYEAAVEDHLHPDSVEAMPDDIIRRYHVDQSELRIQGAAAANWLYKMVSTSAPLQEKTALFWHTLFAAGRAQGQQFEDHREPGRQVPPSWSWELQDPPAGALQRPRDALLARQ